MCCCVKEFWFTDFNLHTFLGRSYLSCLFREWQQLLFPPLTFRFTHVMMLLILKVQPSFVDSVYCSTRVAWAPLVVQDGLLHPNLNGESWTTAHFVVAELVPLAFCSGSFCLPGSLPPRATEPFFLVGELQRDAPATAPLLAPAFLFLLHIGPPIPTNTCHYWSSLKAYENGHYYANIVLDTDTW